MHKNIVFLISKGSVSCKCRCQICGGTKCVVITRPLGTHKLIKHVAGLGSWSYSEASCLPKELQLLIPNVPQVMTDNLRGRLEGGEGGRSSRVKNSKGWVVPRDRIMPCNAIDSVSQRNHCVLQKRVQLLRAQKIVANFFAARFPALPPGGGIWGGCPDVLRFWCSTAHHSQSVVARGLGYHTVFIVCLRRMALLPKPLAQKLNSPHRGF